LLHNNVLTRCARGVVDSREQRDPTRYSKTPYLGDLVQRHQRTRRHPLGL